MRKGIGMNSQNMKDYCAQLERALVAAENKSRHLENEIFELKQANQQLARRVQKLEKEKDQ